MTIDPRDPRPPYRQIADDLRSRIADGELAPDAKLPSSRELASQYGVTQVTASQAVDLLKAEGLVDAAPARGVFVRRKRPVVHVSSAFLTKPEEGERAVWSAEIQRQGAQGTQDLTHVGPVVASPDVAGRLGVAPDATVYVRRRVMRVDGVPVQLADSYFRRDLVEGTEIAEPRKVRGGIIAALERLGVQLGYAIDELTFRMPSPVEVEALRLSSGVPIVRMVRTMFDTADKPVGVDDTLMAGDRHVVSYRVPA